jgi:hypothetical protein
MDPRLLNWGGEGYPEYQAYMKVSGGERTAANAQAQDSQYLQNMMQTQFSEQQNLLNHVLIPQLQQWATHPPGFGMQALAAMRSQALDTIGGQFAAQQRGLQQQFATLNMAGLGSGVQAALGANLAQGAAGQAASAQQQLAIANAQAQMQQQQYALGGLGQASQLLGQAPQSAGLLNQSLGQQFQQQYNMAQQGGFWSNLARGALSAAGTAFLGPLGGMAGSALGGALGLGGSAPTSAAFPGFTPGTIGQPVYANTAPSAMNLPTGAFGQMPSLG